MKKWNCILTKSVFVEADTEEEALKIAEEHDWKNTESIITVEEG